MADRPNVFVSRVIPEEGLAAIRAACEMDLWEDDLPPPREELLRRVAGCDGVLTLLTDRVDDEFLDAAGKKLRVVSNYAVGFDNIDVAACTRRGVMCSNTPDVLTETTADTAWALLMAAARRIAEGDRFLRRRQPWVWGPLMMLGQDMNGRTLGIVGFGRIGQAMARRARGFGMKVIYYDAYRPAPEVERGLGAEFRELDDLLAEADLVTLHTNLSPETHHLINAERLAKMKSTAVLVNTSRGPVIDEVALAQALKEGQIFAAGLDVFEKEPEVHPDLLDLENVVVIPHLGSATVDTRIAMGLLAAENLIAALEGRQPPTLLNPEIWEQRSGRD